MSDRIADKEQFIDAILAVYGTMLSDDDAETEGDGNGAAEAMKRLKKEKLLELPDTSKVEYVTRTFDESGVEILKKALEQDIHKFSHIPCLSDEAFGGNVSGVAMEFKLLGMENITRIKTRYYRKGLRKRLRIFCNYLTTSSRGSIDYKGITAEFTRAMPKNLLEISQFVANLSGVVSTKTLLSQIPFVDDPEENRAVFCTLRQLFVDIDAKNIDNVCMDCLSMGMSNDYTVAIEEGATFVRVGTSIFGQRDYGVER
jgi:SPP1 family phage portal protein